MVTKMNAPTPEAWLGSLADPQLRDQFTQDVKSAHDSIASGEPRERIVDLFRKKYGIPMPMEPWTPESEEGQRDQQKVLW